MLKLNSAAVRRSLQFSAVKPSAAVLVFDRVSEKALSAAGECGVSSYEA